MLRLGPALLTAMLLGVPRALEGRTFGKRAVFVEVAEADPRLRDFGDALERAIRRWGLGISRSPSGAASVIRVHHVFRGPGGTEGVSLSLGDGAATRRLVLHHRPEHREEAALALLDHLSPRGH